ncbi:MAG: CDP-diacylglycerol--glycerol-3-phosphate 3-phosphatidyltransferase [Nanoarchaeota archaeon]
MKHVPNILTIIRILLAVTIPFILLQNTLVMDITALIIFVIAALTDYYDGKLSRKHNIISTFGKMMDPIADKALTLTAFFMFFLFEYLPLWVFVIIAFREILITIIRLYFLVKGKAIAAERAGKVKTTFQFITLSFIYIAMMHNDYIMKFYENTNIAINVQNGLLILMYILIATSLYFTLYSGFLFFKANKKLFIGKKK